MVWYTCARSVSSAIFAIETRGRTRVVHQISILESILIYNVVIALEEMMSSKPAVGTATPNPTALLEYYKEHLNHGRHTETQRTAVTTFSFAFSGALIGEILKFRPLTP